MPVDDAKNEDQQGVSDSHDAGVDPETDPGTAAPTDHDLEDTTSDDSAPAGQAQATETQQDRIVQAIKDIQLLISQASIAGREVPKNLIEIIANASRNYQHADFDAASEAQFWNTVASVTQHVSPITIESILYTRKERQHLRQRYSEGGKVDLWSWFVSLQNVAPYLLFTLLTLAALVYLQIIWVGGTNLVTAIKEFSSSEAQLSEETFRLDRELERELNREAYIVEESDADTSELVSNLRAKSNELVRKRNALQASRFLLEEWVSAYIADPERPLRPGFFASEDTESKWQQEMDAWKLNRDNKRANKTDLMFQQAQSMLQNMSDYFLPLLYGLLGACTYVLRSLAREISGISFSRGSHIQYLLRLLLGLLAGMSVGWFLRTDADGLLDISPFALAFLAGYSVELVFTAMDKIVNAFSGTDATSKSG